MKEDINNLANILIEIYRVDKAITYFEFGIKEAEKVLANNGLVEELDGKCYIEECESLLPLYSIALKALKKYRAEITDTSEEDYEEME